MSNLEQHLSLSAFNAGADKGKPIVAELTLVLGGMDGYGCWGAQDTRKTKQLCKTNLTHKNPTLNLGRGSGESLAYAVIWICFSANARSVNGKGVAGGPISWPRAPCPTFNFWASGFWVSGPTSRRLHSSTDDRRRLGHLVFGA